MEFFDQTPIGRIINRFSKDIEAVDSDLPATLRAFTACLFGVFLGLLYVHSGGRIYHKMMTMSGGDEWMFAWLIPFRFIPVTDFHALKMMNLHFEIQQSHHDDKRRLVALGTNGFLFLHRRSAGDLLCHFSRLVFRPQSVCGLTQRITVEHYQVSDGFLWSHARWPDPSKIFPRHKHARRPAYQ